MAKQPTKTVYVPGKFYFVKLARPAKPLPGVTLLPGASHRIEGSLLETIRDTVLDAVEERETVKE